MSHLIAPPARTLTPSEIRQFQIYTGLSQAEFARRIGRERAVIARLERRVTQATSNAIWFWWRAQLEAARYEAGGGDTPRWPPPLPT